MKQIVGILSVIIMVGAVIFVLLGKQPQKNDKVEVSSSSVVESSSAPAKSTTASSVSATSETASTSMESTSMAE